MIKFEKLHPNAVIPQTKTAFSAGADFCTLEELRIEAGETKVFPLGLRAVWSVREVVGELPFLAMVERSSLRARGLTSLGVGIIDADYEGEIHGLLHNTTKEAVTIGAGERIGQFIFCTTQRVFGGSDAVRGAGGFGSTGL